MMFEYEEIKDNAPDAKDTRDIAFNQGYDAFSQDAGAKNPYPEDTAECHFWFAGYDCALMIEEDKDRDLL